MFLEISYRGRQLPFRGETIQLSFGGQFYCLMPDRKLRRNRSGYYKPKANLSPAGRVKTVWKMSSEGRFGRLSDAEMEKMMSDKNAVNTKRVTQVAIQSLREYTFETDQDIDLHDCTPEQLAPPLRSFYFLVIVTSLKWKKDTNLLRFYLNMPKLFLYVVSV